MSLFITCLWLCWVFVAVHCLSLVVVNMGPRACELSSCSSWALEHSGSAVVDAGLVAP